MCKALPTKEEYQKSQRICYQISRYKPVYNCDKCGGVVVRDDGVVLATYPPKYTYICLGCGFRECI